MHIVTGNFEIPRTYAHVPAFLIDMLRFFSLFFLGTSHGLGSDLPGASIISFKPTHILNTLFQCQNYNKWPYNTVNISG